MKLKDLIFHQRFLAFQANSVFYRITLAFSLFFLGPLLAFLFLGIKTDILGSRELMYCLLGMMVISLGGYIILRQIAEGIVAIEAKLTGKETTGGVIAKTGESELVKISLLADVMKQNVQQISAALTRRVTEIQAIRDINSLSASRMAPQSLIALAIDKAIDISGANGAAVFLLVKGKGESHVISIYSVGDGFAKLSEVRFPLSEFLGKKAFADNKPFLFEDIPSKKPDLFSKDCQKAAAIPFLWLNGQQAAIVLTEGDEENWDETILEFFTTLFTTTSSCLKMQEMGVKEQETSRELQAILAILKVINLEIQENDLLATVAAKLHEVLPYKWLGIALLDEMTEELRLTRTFSVADSDTFGESLLEKNTSLFYRSIDVMERVDCDDLAADDFSEKEMFARLGLRSCMVDRLQVNGRVIGSICLGSDKPYLYTSHEKKVFSQLVTGIALAMAQTRLLTKEKTKSFELETLNKIGMALTSSAFDTRRVLQYILDMLVSLIPVEAGTVMLLEQEVLKSHATIGIAEENLEHFSVQLGQGICGWVAATGESVVIDDVRMNPHFYPGIDDKTGFATKNLMCASMISNGRVIGIIQLINNKAGYFLEEDLRMIKSVASSTAIALENARLHEESMQLVEKERLVRTVFQKYVPEEVINTILARGGQDHTAHGERKIITVFNVDIRGYTEMSRSAATEDIVGVLNYFYMRMGSIVLRHKGVLDKYLGDGFLAIFGAPVATRNPALDATYAAIEMVKILEEVGKMAMDRCGVPLKIGISLNTGEAIVGNIGFDKKMEYTAIGNVVNETFRLQELTREKSDLILMSESTYLQVKSFIVANPWGERIIDDRGGKMKIYEVVSRKEISDIRVVNTPLDVNRGALQIH